MNEKGRRGRADGVYGDCSLGRTVGRLTGASARVERRVWPRRLLELDACLTHADSHIVVRVRTGNLGSGGFYVILAGDLPLRPGERVHVQIIVPETGRHPGTLLVACQAVVAHSAFLLDESECRLGVGFTFDRPRTIDLPESPRMRREMPQRSRSA